MSVSSLLGPRGCLFTFHRVAPSALWKTLPNRDFYIDLEFFDRLLTYLRRTGWTFVTIDEALRRAGRANSEDRYVNFSVDDGYRDTYELVVPLFRRHGVPITIYVTTGIPDGTIPLWWAGLEETLLRRDPCRRSSCDRRWDRLRQAARLCPDRASVVGGNEWL